MLARVSSGDACQLEVQKHLSNCRRRRWSLVSPVRGQNTTVPMAMSIPGSSSSNGGGAQLSPDALAISPRDVPEAMPEGWDQAVSGHAPTSSFQ